MRRKMKVLFLDFDGVLNSDRWMRAQPPTTNFLRVVDKVAVARLDRIVERTGCVIVVSSTWRILNSLANLRSILIEAGLSHCTVIDKTTTEDCGPEGEERWWRGHQIQRWLDEHEGQVESFCILDDDSDMAHLMPKLVHTTWESGMLDEHVEQAVKMLGEKAPDADRPARQD